MPTVQQDMPLAGGTSKTRLRCLNLGCGRRFHPDWINVDFCPAVPGIVVYDLRKGIPFPSCRFDVVYHSHILEHFRKTEAAIFIRECHRVLSPLGVLRVAVPDLECIARGYLSALERASDDQPNADGEYDWMMLELYDQTVRERSGGEMLAYLSNGRLDNLAFASRRLGGEVTGLVNYIRHREQAPASKSRVKRAVQRLLEFRRYPHRIRELVLRLLLGTEYKALRVGRLRAGGEIHQWMYDVYSLGRLLRACGFREIQRCAASESRVANWRSYNLDTEADGSVYKPDSLYMEGVKGVGAA